ncbi:helix-turn-helix transcriptional regulator [Nonomuraea rhodomycinica]|uniref:Helix-turn-helix domain-containing protein n=1 Tax=Nonomuraea rhodomycinica TaxID=1712872 RepID=A0A7Y6M9P3_9ACTN|nr:helix-turn-helix transcriptional regulator [Nonomuraea rhodomycinica]NUW38614.1 helix-turn-helix domain-containing protein [Nonomuraea rhodomycinica]
MSSDLGDFLRSRRARIQPEELGLQPYGRRRVPGLRREEVAQLAGVSVDYYIRLEQDRGQSVSDAVLDAVARVLRLDEVEQAHLRDLARPQRQDPPQESRTRTGGQRVRPAMRLIVESVSGPAFLLGRYGDVLAWNALGDAVVGFSERLSRFGERGLNQVRDAFLNPATREFYVDWPAVAADTVAFLRLEAGRRPRDKRLAALVGELSLASEEFGRLWADHQVKEKTFGVKRMLHPVVGRLDLGYEALTPPGDPDQMLIVYTATPGSEAAEKLAVLASWSAAPSLPAP